MVGMRCSYLLKPPLPPTAATTITASTMLTTISTTLTTTTATTPPLLLEGCQYFCRMYVDVVGVCSLHHKPPRLSSRKGVKGDERSRRECVRVTDSARFHTPRATGPILTRCAAPAEAAPRPSSYNGSTSVQLCSPPKKPTTFVACGRSRAVVRLRFAF